MAGKYPEEFREDVVAVAKNREAGVSLKQIAADFGISYATLTNWMRQDATDAGEREGRTSDQKDELRELRRRNRLLEQENLVLRRAAAYLSQANLPSKGSIRSWEKSSSTRFPSRCPSTSRDSSDNSTTGG